MLLTIALWSDPSERVQDFVEATSRHKELAFGTSAMGGFGDASFTISAGGWSAVRWYRSYLGYHMVIFDHLGRRLYEGRIEDTDTFSGGVKLNALGYYSHGQELTHGMVYPAGTPTTATDIVRDTINIAWETSRIWNPDTSMVKQLYTDIAPQDFSMGKKLSNALDACIQFGNDAIIPKPMYVAVWENRRLYFYEEPNITNTPNWRTYRKDFANQEGLSLSRTRGQVWNKLQVVYDDPLIGTTFTQWAENKDSQRLFGIREGTLNIGQALPGISETVRDLALNSYAFPEQSSSFGISGRVYNGSGAPEYPYMVRAGQILQIADYDPSAAQLVSGSSGLDSSTVFISRTDYRADDNSLTLELGKRNVQLDLLMARLGLGAGSVS